MAKKKYRISKPNLMGGSVQQSKEGMQNMQAGGTTATDQQQMQAFMSSVYGLFKNGMTSTDVELQLTSQGYPYEFIQNTIQAVQNYMDNIGESYDEESEVPTDLAGMSQQAPMQQESEESRMNAAKMDQYGQQSMDAAMADDEESDELLNRENPYMQEGGEMEAKEPSLPYFPNQEIVMATGPSPYNMSKGGKVSRKKFMKNVLKRFEEGGPKETPLSSAPKKDTLEKDVEKATKGFVSAVQGKAKESVAKEMYKLVEESGDPKLQEMLMSGNQQQQPMQPMAREGMMVDDDYCQCEDGSYSPECCSADVRDYVESESDMYNQQMGNYGDDPSKISRKLVTERDRDLIRNYMGANEIEGFEVTPNRGFYKGLPLLDYTDMDGVDMNKEYSRAYLNKLYSEKDPRVMAKLQGLDAALEGENDASDIPAALDRYYPPKQQYGGMQYANKGLEAKKEEIKNNPKKGNRMYSFLLNNPIPDAENPEPEVDPETDPGYELGEKVYDRRYEYTTTPGRRGLFNALFPANAALGYRPKYYVDPRLGKPVARDVYGKTLFGGKKYIDYYEMPDEDFDPEILRRKDINKRARQGNRSMKRMLKGKGPIADALNTVLNRDDDDDERGDSRTDLSKFDRIGSRGAIRRGERRARNQRFDADGSEFDPEGIDQADINATTDAELESIMNDPASNAGQAPISESMMDNPMPNLYDPNYSLVESNTMQGSVTEDDVLNLKEQFPDEFIDVDAIPYESSLQYNIQRENAMSANSAKALELMQRRRKGLTKFTLGGFDPSLMSSTLTAVQNQNQTQQQGLNNLQEMANNPRGDMAMNSRYVNNARVTEPGVESFDFMGERVETGERTDGGDDEKRKLIGIENKDKLGIMDGEAFLNPLNATTNRVVGGLENIGEERREAQTIEDATNPLNRYTAVRNQDRGDFNIYGDFRLNEQGFEGSTNNEGPTSGGMARKGGPVYDRGQVVEMSLPEMQAFMEAGGTLEFL